MRSKSTSTTDVKAKFDQLLEQADKLIADAMRTSKSVLAQDDLKNAQLLLDDATAHDKQVRRRKPTTKKP